jgi:general secretion pathway protein D
LNEVLIAEIRLTGELKYGLEFFLGSRPTSATQQTTGTDGTTTTPAPTGTAGLDIFGPASAAFTAAGGFVFIAQDVYNNIKAIISLMASEGKATILASPHIMAANNQEARIQIGDEVPILTSTSTPLISQVTSFQTSTVQYRSTGIILVVKPQINANGMVTLEIAQEVSAAVPTALGGVRDTPTISIRQAKTSLITGDNQTIVLGGLIREDLSRTRTGIPGLRKVPIFGPLFGSEGTKSEKTELLVLITPHIVTNMAEGAKVTRDMKDKTGLEEKTPQQSRPGAPGVPEKKELAPWY